MAFCSNCGAELREGAKFCEGCGAGTSTVAEPRQRASTSASASSHRLSMATLYTDWKTVLLKPKLFFDELANRQRNLIAPSAFIGLLWVLLMALLLIFGLMTGSSKITEAPGFIFSVAAMTILFVVPAMFLTAAFYHVFVKLFGGTGSYADTYNVVAYSMAVMPFSILIIPGWYAVYLVYVGFLKLHSMSPKQAIGAILTPFVISLIIVAISIAAMYSFFLGMFGQPSEIRNRSSLNQSDETSSRSHYLSEGTLYRISLKLPDSEDKMQASMKRVANTIERYGVVEYNIFATTNSLGYLIEVTEGLNKDQQKELIEFLDREIGIKEIAYVMDFETVNSVELKRKLEKGLLLILTIHGDNESDQNLPMAMELTKSTLKNLGIEDALVQKMGKANIQVLISQRELGSGVWERIAPELSAIGNDSFNIDLSENTGFYELNR